jgi:hypothetical protein
MNSDSLPRSTASTVSIINERASPCHSILMHLILSDPPLSYLRAFAASLLRRAAVTWGEDQSGVVDG